MKYRKKPVVIEAVKFDGSEESAQEIDMFVGQHIEACDGGLLISTLEGTYRAVPGDWIIKGVKGEFYPPCKPDIFAMTYESVEQSPANANAQDARNTLIREAGLEGNKEGD